jgi:thioredoxin-like negative regulator of GroEL
MPKITPQELKRQHQVKQRAEKQTRIIEIQARTEMKARTIRHAYQARQQRNRTQRNATALKMIHITLLTTAIILLLITTLHG